MLFVLIGPFDSMSSRFGRYELEVVARYQNFTSLPYIRILKFVRKKKKKTFVY